MLQKVAPKEVMQEALALQVKQTQADETWLKGLGLDTDMVDQILIRMVQQRGEWLDFVAKLVEFKGDFRELT